MAVLCFILPFWRLCTTPMKALLGRIFNKHVITCPNQVVTRENGTSSPAVRAVEACDSSCKGGLILSAEHMKSGQSDLSSVLLRSTQLLTLWQQQQLTVFR